MTRGSWFTPVVALVGCGVALAAAQRLIATYPLATVAVLLGAPAVVVLGVVSLARGASARTRLVVRVLAVATLASVIAGIHRAWDQTTAQPMLAMMLAGPIGLGALALWYWGGEYIAVDVPAGTARVVTIKKRVSLPLERLGSLAIVEKARQGLRNQRFVHYELVASELPEIVLFTSHDRSAIESRRGLIEELIAASAVRGILATTTMDPGAFRAAPDLVYRLRQAVAEPSLLRRALASLARDRDERVRARAAEVTAQLNSVGDDVKLAGRPRGGYGETRRAGWLGRQV